jgi:hypothetical protein
VLDFIAKSCSDWGLWKNVISPPSITAKTSRFSVPASRAGFRPFRDILSMAGHRCRARPCGRGDQGSGVAGMGINDRIDNESEDRKDFLCKLVASIDLDDTLYGITMQVIDRQGHAVLPRRP